MGQPIPINFAAAAAKAAQAETAKELAVQTAGADDVMASTQTNFNAAAAARAQKRYDKFKSLEARSAAKKSEAETEGDVLHVAEAEKTSDEELAQRFQQRNPELPANRLKRLRANITDDLTEEQILDEVQQAFTDPTLADEALEYLEQSTTGELKEKISIAKQLQLKEKGREIIGGRNIDAVAKDFAARGYGTSPTALRDLYRDVTGTERDHTTLFEMLSQQYPYEQLKEIVSFLLKAMAYDKKSKGPSIAKPELMRLMTETRNLQSVVWVYRFFKGRVELMRKLYEEHGMKYPESLSFEVLAKSFMKTVSERYPSAGKVKKEAERIGLMDDNAKIIVLSQYREAVRGLSPRLYNSVQHKQDLLLAVIETLESLEDIEEEA